MDTHIFVTTGNNSGSTFILNLLDLCKNTICFPRNEGEVGYTISEGQHLSGSMPNFKLSNDGLVWTEQLDKVCNPVNYQWECIKKSWGEEWRKSKNFHNKERIFVEKSPHNLGRVHILQEEFDNAWFLIQVRNPYVVSEGIRRRMGSSCDIRRAGLHSIRMLGLAKTSLEKYEQVLAWRYEDLFCKPDIIQNMIADSIIGLEDFSLQEVIPSKMMGGYQESKLIDQNQRQLDSLSEKDIRILNSVFDEYSNIMTFFNYRRLK